MRQHLTTYFLMALVATSFVGNITGTLGNSSTTIVFRAHSDCYVSEQNPGSCYGREVVLNVRSFSEGGGHFNQRTYISFNVSALPKSIQIVSALLWLYKNPEGANPGTRNIQAFRVVGAWSEYTLNWNNQPAYSSNPSFSTRVRGALKWYVWDLTQDVNVWHQDLATNHGMMLKDEDENSATDFASVFLSREASHPQNPYLEIEYSESRVETVNSANSGIGNNWMMNNLASWSIAGFLVIVAVLVFLGSVASKKPKWMRSLVSRLPRS